MSPPLQMHNIIRILLLVLVTGIWILAGFFDTNIIVFLETLISSSFPGTSLMEKFPLYIYYSIYCGLCLCIIHLFFWNGPTTRLAALLYVLLFIFTLTVNEAGKILQYEPFRITAYRMMTIIVSPFLLILMISAKYLIQYNNKARKATDGGITTPNTRE
jgi:hypothetical protein